MLAFSATFAQKTALVLSGGGAKAIAHIGVIKALEEQGIRIDCIVGSSMGAMVGAMYASGMTTAEMETYFTLNDIESWVSEEKDPLQLYYFMEDGLDASIIHLDFDINKMGIDIPIPSNIISGNRLNFELMKMFSKSCATAHRNFDELFIPFRCIATDIDKSEIVIMRSGSLCQSVRASMTFPFILDPIRIDDKLLFDGGMMDNFPVDIAISEFNPDFIIGSKAAGNYDAPRENDLLSIVQNMLTIDAKYNTREKAGFVIELSLPSIDIVDFSRTEEIIDSAYQQTIEYLLTIDNLHKIKVDEARWQAKRDSFNTKKPDLIIDGVSVRIPKKKRDKEVLLDLSVYHKSKIKNYLDVERDFFRIAAHPSFSKVQVSMPYSYDKGSFDVQYAIKRKDPYSVDFGGNISSSNLTQLYLKIAYQSIGKNRFSSFINGYFGQFYRSAKASVRFDIGAGIPISIGVSGTYNHKNYFKGATYFFEDEEAVYLKDDERFMQFEWGIPYKSEGRFLAGLASGASIYNYYQSNTFSKLDTADQTHYEFFSPYVKFELSKLNRKLFPDRGLFFSLTARYFNGLEKFYPGSVGDFSNENNFGTISGHQYYSIDFQYENYFLHHHNFHMGFKLDGKISSQSLFSNYISSLLVAHQYSPLLETKALFIPNLRSFNFASGGFVFSNYFTNRLAWRTDFYLYQPYQKIVSNHNKEISFDTEWSYRYFIASTALIYYSRLGPVSLSLNYNDASTQRWSVFFNFGYPIFNDSYK